MEYLQSRGPVVIKRAYADWTRFPRYRDEMLGNSIDLIQLYDVRAGKNRADIRMALDAFETAITRPQVQTIALVTGDSDFGTLVSKLREYGRYVLGLGPSKITHAILVKSCDEFVFLETIFGEAPAAMGRSALSLAEADHLLQKALAVHGRRGELLCWRPSSSRQCSTWTRLSTRKIWVTSSFATGWRTGPSWRGCFSRTFSSMPLRPAS